MGRLTNRERVLRRFKVKAAPDADGFFLVGKGCRLHLEHAPGEMSEAECGRVLEILGGSAGGKPRPCECGCGSPAKPGRNFLPGHDMKLKSALRAKAAGGGARAAKQLARRGWA